MGALHSQNSRSTLPTPLHQLHSTPPFIVHSVWESSTPQIPEVQLPVPHRPNEQAAAQFSPPNFSHFHAGPVRKLSSTSISTLPVLPPSSRVCPKGSPALMAPALPRCSASASAAPARVAKLQVPSMAATCDTNPGGLMLRRRPSAGARLGGISDSWSAAASPGGLRQRQRRCEP